MNSLSSFGCSGSCVSAMTMPFFRSAAPSRVITSVLPSGVVIMSLIDRALTMIESTIVGLAGSEMSTAYTRSPPMIVPRYATLPFGWIHTSLVAKALRINFPTTLSGRLMSRSTAVTTASPLRAPKLAVT